MTNRHIAHITLEAQTPLKVGSNGSDFLQDSPIQRDWNNLPVILGTSIAGVLRKEFKGDKKDIFGEQNGSKVIISNALLLDEKGKVHEELLLEKTPFLKIFDTLPIREHTAINEKGTAIKGAKFDEEILYKGSQFKFSLEFIDADEKIFLEILNLLLSSSFRLGGGSTKGFGKLKIIEIKTDSFDFSKYIEMTSSLNMDFGKIYNPKETKSNYTNYTLNIKPDDFFMFGSGFGDEDADQKPVYEKVIDYKNSKLSDDMILIPASSIKGAIAHRTTYHYNLQNNKFIGNENIKPTIPEIFGEAKESDTKKGSKGKVIFSDCFKEDRANAKVFNHVSIDRFTGGAINGALFQEKTIADDREYQIEILLDTSVENQYKEAFNAALTDITTGMLSLGGATTKGHGIFSGKLFIDGVKYEKK